METQNPTRLIEEPIKNGRRWPKFFQTDIGPMTIQEMADSRHIRIAAMYQRLEVLAWDDPKMFLYRRTPKSQRYETGIGNDEWNALGDKIRKRPKAVKIGWWEYQQLHGSYKNAA